MSMKFFNICLFFFIAFFAVQSYAQMRSDGFPPPPEAAEPAYDKTFRVVNEVDLSVDNRKVYKDAPTHPLLRLTPDRSEIVRVDTPVNTVIVGNPLHLSVLPSTSQGLILVGKRPGATHFIALDKDENIVMQRYVVVAAPKGDYVRIRKTCAGKGDDNCKTTSLYYCPDACHETLLQSDDSKGGSDTSSMMSGGGNAPDELMAPPPANIPDQ